MKRYFEKLYQKGTNQFHLLLAELMCEEKKSFVVTANPETFMTGCENKEFDNLLKDENTMIVPDGIGIVKAAHIAGYQVKERITGVEIAQFLFEEANRQEKSIYLLGAKEEVVSALVTRIKNLYPKVIVAGYENGYTPDKDTAFEKIAEIGPDIVLVALGIPQQELLIYRHLHQFNKGIFVGVGGGFDVLSGTKKRAPKIFIKLNMEWLYRIVREPNRLGRFFKSNVRFMMVLKKELKSNK